MMRSCGRARGCGCVRSPSGMLQMAAAGPSHAAWEVGASSSAGTGDRNSCHVPLRQGFPETDDVLSTSGSAPQSFPLPS